MDIKVKDIIVPKDIFVVIAPDDVDKKRALLNPNHEINPVVIETHLETATKANAQQYARRIENTRGKCIIGQVVISDLDQVNRPQSVADMLKKENDKLDDLINALDGDQCIDSKRYKILEWVRNL